MNNSERYPVPITLEHIKQLNPEGLTCGCGEKHIVKWEHILKCVESEDLVAIECDLYKTLCENIIKMRK